MKILAIETSCDDTAIALLEVKKSKFRVLGDTIISQTKIHEKYGGVFPMKAKMAHAKNLVPALLKVLKLKKHHKTIFPEGKIVRVRKILEREPELFDALQERLLNIRPPKIDRIAVTYGPGLEPALWVGINFAKALSIFWNVPIVPVNHMRGHFLAPLAESKTIKFPALGLLISGGHTELILAKSPTSCKLLGATRDDACGEAYDKVARILGLPYPGGPHIARLAEKARSQKLTANNSFTLPRPMMHSKNLEFSFAGLKTAVLYLVRKVESTRLPSPERSKSGQGGWKVEQKEKEQIAREFEEAVKDVLVSKTAKALAHMSDMWEIKTLVVGGGVSANTYIMKNLKKLAEKFNIKFLGSSKALATDNAVMIGVAGLYTKAKPLGKIRAVGNLPIEK